METGLNQLESARFARPVLRPQLNPPRAPRPVLKPRPVLDILSQHTIQYSRIPAQPIKLSKAAMEVLQWLSLGKRSADIAELMDISKNNVHQHTHRIMNFLGAGTPAGAVGIALRKNIIS